MNIIVDITIQKCLCRYRVKAEGSIWKWSLRQCTAIGALVKFSIHELMSGVVTTLTTVRYASTCHFLALLFMAVRFSWAVPKLVALDVIHPTNYAQLRQKWNNEDSHPQQKRTRN